MDFRNQKEYREEFSSWLDNYQWQFWFTGTFRAEMTVNTVDKCRRCFGHYLKKVGGRKAEGKIDYFMAIEWNKAKVFTHVHSLISGVVGKDEKDLWEKWFYPYGRAVVERYEKGLGANHYLTKYCLKELCDWDLRIDGKRERQGVLI